MRVLPSNTIALLIKKFVLIMVAVFLVFTPASSAFAASADTSAPSASASCNAAATPPNGVQRPTGSDAGTYTYNSCTGLWENPYYTWSPVTQEASPKTPYIYTCNQNTWKWMTQQWVYDPAAGKFEQVVLSVAKLPADAIIATDSLISCTPPVAPTAAPSSPTNTANTVPGADPTVSVTGPNSTNATNATDNSNAVLNNGTSVALGNKLNTNANSGNAAVLSNTSSGGATTGNAMAAANVINAVQSSSPILGGNVATFVANINGNVQGDLLIDPSQLQPASNSSALNSKNLTINSKNSGQITNDINVGAQSGDATVADNSKAGDATTGDATTVADVVNMLDSIVSAGKSFVGVVNINGNMNGNILVPQNFLNSLIASNAPSTTVTLSATDAKNLGITNTNNTAITNNLSNTATTGTAEVADNTNAGSATTGNASTKVTVFNLTGNQIVGANCLLVFVNVSGRWVGVIMDAPAGATAAALGGGVAQNTVNVDNATINNQTNDAITNNINLASVSGNAAVRDNTQAGNARSGNAETATNLLNMDNSQLNLTGWFGILFINIFGNWYGSFGAYNPPAAPSTTPGGNSSPSGGSSPNTSKAAGRMFEYVDHPQVSPASTNMNTDEPSFSTTTQLVSQTTRVLGSNVVWHATPARKTNTSFFASHEPQVIGAVLVVVGISLFLTDRVVTARASRKA